MRLLISLLITSLCASCIAQEENRPVETETMDIRYLALGDSYTIGESVETDERWPVQLAAQLEQDKVHTSELKIIARTGWRTNQLIDAIEQENPGKDWDLVSLLIGVNNQYRNYPIEQYRKEFSELLETSIKLAQDNPKRVFVVSIPDYAFTPFGQTREVSKITKDLNEYNAIADSICSERNIPFIDITDISRRGLDEPNLVAGDQLHPSGDMYRLWTEKIYSTVLQLIR